jgi:hypothetical protein
MNPISLRIFVSVLASENFLSKSSLFTPVAPRLKTKALLLMSVDRCEGKAEASGFGEYRVIYHKNNGDRFFLSFEAKYPNPEPKKGKAGCFAVA